MMGRQTRGQEQLFYAFRADRKNIPDNQHPDHQFGINRWPPEDAVERRKLPVNPARVEHRINTPNQMIYGDNFIKVERVDLPRSAGQSRLSVVLRPGA